MGAKQNLNIKLLGEVGSYKSSIVLMFKRESIKLNRMDTATTNSTSTPDRQPAAPAPENISENKPQNHKSKLRMIVMLIIVAIAIVLALLWWLNYRKYITSDDANLDSYRIDVAPQVSGRITRLYVHEGDSVTIGDTLFSIDSRTVVSRHDAAIAQYNQIISEVEVAKLALSDAGKELELEIVAEKLAAINYNRAKAQYQGDAIPLEEFQTNEENWKSARLRVEIAKNKISSAEASIISSQMSAEAAKADARTIATDLSYYHVTAPTSGIIGKRWCLAGDIVNAGQNVFTLNSGNDIWVAVYLDETKFKNISLGQEVKFTLDAYDKLTFYGQIYYIGDNAASEFALVPPNNASGNYTKVTQRIPLKISIESVEGDEEQKKNHKLVSGMSANIKIEKK